MPTISEIAIDENLANQICNELNKENIRDKEMVDERLKGLRIEYAKLNKRKDIMYEDRLDGGITIDKYNELATKTDQRLQEIDNEIVRLEKTRKESTFDVSYLLKLASMSEKLLKSSKVKVKNEILRLLLSNLEIKQKRLQFKVLEPFCYLQKLDSRPM